MPNPEARFAWIYAGASTRSEGWLAKTNSGEIIGFSGLLYRNIKMGDHRLEVGQAVDLVVDSPHRAFGPIHDLQRALICSVDQRTSSFIYGFPDRRLEKLFQRIGYRRLGQMERWTKPLRSEYWIGKHLSFPTVANISGRMVDAVLRWTTREQSYTNPDWASFAVKDDFDERFDDLYTRGVVQYDVVAERTASYLKWRFRHSQHLPYRVLTLSDNSEELRGYIVFFCEKEEARIMDAFAESRDFLNVLMCEFILMMRMERMSSISCNYMGSDWFSCLMREWGFYKRPIGAPMMVHCNSNSSVNSILDRMRWFMTDGDRDV